MEKAEIIIYKEEINNSDFQIEVRVEDDTVWLTQAQMAELFQSTRNNITLHIGNVFKEGELEQDSVCKDSLLTALDGKRYKTKFYNLDVIISVGYRVKSQRGTQFRIWANKILKEYLLKGYVLNHRVDRIEHKLMEHDQKFDMIIKSSLKPTEGIFYDGQIFDAWQFVAGLIKEANDSIILIDNYIDESVLMLLAKRNPDVSAIIFTGKISNQLETDLKKHNRQYPVIELKHFTKSHDRFLIIDTSIVYHIGASLKDLGKKWFAFSKINLDAEELLKKLED
ncbi:MAG: virulence RhuM family protein [Bacteroidales bacterium]|nr:virulence RhuM family protein [Bacteroidales bacterium]MCF8455742.1 virulence RhuM family protein [Bacteroidales bacterium]